jgi:hypothetical protein
MTSQRWNKLVSVSVFGLVLATADSAQAQWGYPLGYGSYGAGGYGVPSNFIGFPMAGYAESSGQVPIGSYGSYGAGGYGVPSNFIGFPSYGYAQSSGQVPLTGYGSYGYGAGGYGVPSNFIGFPSYGYAQSTGQVPLTSTSFSSVSGAASLVPGWGGSGHGTYHRYRSRPVAPRAASRR